MSSSPTLDGLPVHVLKRKAAVDQDPSSQSLIAWIQLAQQVYTSATTADSQNRHELAYVHYFKAAGVLQVILKHPEFTSLKTKNPTDFRVYLEVASKILASTDRAKRLAEILEHRSTTSTTSSSSSNAARTRKIGTTISSRMKIFESTPPDKSPSSSSIQKENFSPPQQSSPSPSSQVQGLQHLSTPPSETLSDHPNPSSFVSTALEAQATIRSGSAPPELTVENTAFTTNPNLKLQYNIGNGFPSANGHSLPNDQASSNSFPDYAQVEIRTPSQFNQVFPSVEDSELNQSNQSPGPSRPLPELPSVPTTLPSKRSPVLPPPPQPFELAHSQSDSSTTISSTASDHLVNDTSLGASLADHAIHRNSSPVGAPPPYPNFEIEQSPLSPPREKSLAPSSASVKSPGHSKSTPSIEWTLLSSSKSTTFNNNPPNPVTTTSLPKLPTLVNEILPATLMDYFRKSASLGVDTKVLFLDVRTRPDFESCRIKSDAVVCIEPLILLKNGGRGVSSTEIEQSLILSPKREQTLFETRQTFDYVVIYDKRSTQFPVDRSKTLLHSSDPSEETIRLLLLLYLAIHKEEYVKQLKQPPFFLSGGIEGWIKIAGEAGVVGKGFSTQSAHPTAQLSEITSSLNGISITLRQPPNKDTNQMANEKQNGSSEIKKARRQVALFQRDGSISNPDFIVRSVADLTRSSAPSYHLPTSPSISNFQSSRPGLPPPYSPSSYRSNGITSSPITLPQQTLQRLKSSELYGVNPSSNESTSSGYSSTASNHLPPSLYQPSSRPPPSVPPITYDTHQSLSLTSHPMDIRYGGFTSNPIRPSIQYPSLVTKPRPLQPPPAALTPGGSTVIPSHFNRSSPYAPFPPPPALLGGELRNTPPITPFTPHRHGPSEIYFNPSFEDVQVGFTGLKNLGNTCYMNSTIQCLSATIPLARFFKDGSYKRCINRTNPLGTKGLLAESVAELVRVLWGAQYTFVSPITFREAICRFAPQFRGSDQQDAQEFLGFLLDGLHEDLNLVTSKPAPIEMTPEREAALETLPTQVASAREWEVYKRRDNSVIVELFQGQYRSRLQCLTCNTTSTTYNTFMYLSLPIPNKRGISKVSLTQCLDAFLKEEIMEKDDAWNCPRCKTRRKATKRLSLARLPPILLIHLKRFSFKGPFSDKLETFVQYPLYGLDLSSYVPPPLPTAQNETIPSPGYHSDCSSRLSHVYDLYAVCNHFGSLSSGHYTAFARSQKDWYNIGDSRVSKTDEKSVKARSAYLLCFRRRD